MYSVNNNSNSYYECNLFSLDYMVKFDCYKLNIDKQTNVQYKCIPNYILFQNVSINCFLLCYSL